jgi:eukaryotic-like serine/threonine-protein kinase
VARRFSLGTRIFTMTAVLVTLAVGAAVAVTWLLGHRIAHQTAREALKRSASVQSVLQQQRLEQLRLLSRLFASDRHLAAYVAEGEALGDVASILDVLEERQNDLGFDFAIVLDPEGRVLAHSDDPDAVGEDLSGRALVTRALEDFDGFGIWRQGGVLHHAVAVPLAVDRLLVGFVIAGFAIDDVSALEIRGISGTEVAFLTGAAAAPQLVASTLD